MATADIEHEVDSEPALHLAQQLKGAGVLDAPRDIVALRKAMGAMSAENDQLRAEQRSVKSTVAELNTTIANLKGMVSVSNQPNLTLNLPESCKAIVEGTPQNVVIEDKRQGFTDEQAELIGKTVAIAVAAALVPVFKALAERPVSEVHLVEKAVPGQTVIEHVHHDAPQVAAAQVNFDLAPLVEATAENTKVLKKLLEKTPQPTDLTPVLKKLEEQGERMEKALSRPAPRHVSKKLSQNEDGDWIVTPVEG